MGAGVGGTGGAGGSMGAGVGAILMGFMFKMDGVTYQSGLFIIGGIIVGVSFLTLFIVPLFDKVSVGSVEPAYVRVPVDGDVRHH